MFTQSLVTLLSVDKCLAGHVSASVGVFVENNYCSSLVKFELTVPAVAVLPELGTLLLFWVGVWDYMAAVDIGEEQMPLLMATPLDRFSK